MFVRKKSCTVNAETGQGIEANDEITGIETQRPTDNAPAQDSGWVEGIRLDCDEAGEAAAKQSIEECERSITDNRK
jgi:hypothetical protein